MQKLHQKLPSSTVTAADPCRSGAPAAWPLSPCVRAKTWTGRAPGSSPAERETRFETDRLHNLIKTMLDCRERNCLTRLWGVDMVWSHGFDIGKAQVSRGNTIELKCKLHRPGFSEKITEKSHGNVLGTKITQISDFENLDFNLDFNLDTGHQGEWSWYQQRPFCLLFFRLSMVKFYFTRNCVGTPGYPIDPNCVGSWILLLSVFLSPRLFKLTGSIPVPRDDAMDIHHDLRQATIMASSN